MTNFNRDKNAQKWIKIFHTFWRFHSINIKFIFYSLLTLVKLHSECVIIPTPFFIFPISWALNEEMTWKMIPLSLFIRNVIWPYKWRTVFVMKIPKDDNKSPMSRAIDGASFMPQDVVVSSECQCCQCCLLYLCVEFINFYTFLSAWYLSVY